MSSNWDGQRYQGAARVQAALDNAQAVQSNQAAQASPHPLGTHYVRIAQLKLDELDTALGRHGREALHSALDALLSGVPRGPVRDALYDSLIRLAELVLWAQRA